MSQTLESFAGKHGLSLVVTETRKSVTIFSSKKGKLRRVATPKEVVWKCELRPPSLFREIRTRKREAVIPLAAFSGETRALARKKLLERIRGSVLEWSNAFDRICGSDPRLKVPRTLR